jgi:hypothetical protein
MIASSLASKFSSRTRLGARALSNSMRAMSVVVGFGLLNPHIKLRRSTIDRQNWGSASTCLLCRKGPGDLPTLQLAIFALANSDCAANTNPGVLLSRGSGDPAWGLTRGLGGRIP